MRPFQHAQASAPITNDWKKDLAVHEFMDSTKFACADRRHRVVLHHIDLGAAIVARAFPHRQDTAKLVEQHVCEDLGHAVSLEDWFDIVDSARLPSPIHRRVDSGYGKVAQYVSGRLSQSAHPEANAVCEFLFSPTTYLSADPLRALSLMMNSCGPMIVRKVFGKPRTMPDGKIVDFGWIAEAAIFTAFGRIPDLREIIDCWDFEPTRKEMATTK
ncbi:hypothetical protein WG622_17950 [Cognatishimia sp. D5M38]|uniref:DUF6915 domain-containing protein n=1 Tax=Cognatishimia coralii TaxID=3083254 RepID=A0ABU8QL50_9RHOB